MSDKVLSQCDPVLNRQEAEAPVLSALIPVKGLRRDLSGNLTKDSMTTIVEGLKSLGVVINSELSKTAVLQESRTALCKLNGQFDFLLNEFVTNVARSEMNNIDEKLFTSMKEKNQHMQDVIAVSRHVLSMPIDKVKEGFLGEVADPFADFRESFQEMESVVNNNNSMISSGNVKARDQRALDVSNEKNLYAERLTNMYGLLNVTAIGLLFYIMYSK
jgi:soluble cytochrome b562